MNRVILVGRLTKDPELRSTASGTPVCSFTVACDRRFVKQGEKNGAPAKSPEGKDLAGKRSNNGVDESFANSKTEEQNLLRRQADFINCIAWQKSAEAIAQYFGKGDRIALEGSLQTRSWDGEDGRRHYVTEVVVDQWELAQSKGERAEAAAGKSLGGRVPPGAAELSDSKPGEPLSGDLDGFLSIEDEDLPF